MFFVISDGCDLKRKISAANTNQRNGMWTRSVVQHVFHFNPQHQYQVLPPLPPWTFSDSFYIDRKTNAH